LSEETVNHDEAPVLDALADYHRRRHTPFTPPGHKHGRGADPRVRAALGDDVFRNDLLATSGLDDRSGSGQVIQRAEQLMADAVGAEQAFFSTCGSSLSVKSAMLAVAGRHGRLLVGRDAHKSVISGLVLSGLQPAWLHPQWDAELHLAHPPSPEDVERALDRDPDVAGVMITSPTPYGTCADVARIAELCHGRGLPLIVDEAWGAHLAFHPDLPSSALSLGADLVISSIHKIVGSLTQSALLHLGHDSLLELDVVDRCVTLLESTSPNSYLYASLDSARRAAAVNGEELLSETLSALRATRRAVRAIPDLDVLDERLAGAPGVFDYDPLRLAIDVRGTSCSGYDLARRLREEHDVQMELAGENVMVAVFGMSEDATAAGERLVNALRRVIDDVSAARPEEAEVLFAPPPPWGELVMTPREAFLGPQEVVPAREAIGRVAAESLAAYPPGIPNVLPGERLSAETLDYVQQALDHGGALRGASDRKLHTLRVALEP
jgi:arginine/lysine/ornithine decarboxylase